MATTILTSAGFLNPKVTDFFLKEIFELKDIKVAIITTAAEGKENHKYSKLAHDQLSSFGFKYVEFVDLENNSSLEKYNVFYVCGGNVFHLMKYALSTNFKQAVLNLFKRHGIYIGVSAGSLIIGPSIKIASKVNPDEIPKEDVNFEGLNIFPITIFPHYEEKYENEIIMFENENNQKVLRLNNFQAYIIKNDESKIIE